MTEINVPITNGPSENGTFEALRSRKPSLKLVAFQITPEIMQCVDLKIKRGPKAEKIQITVEIMGLEWEDGSKTGLCFKGRTVTVLHGDNGERTYELGHNVRGYYVPQTRKGNITFRT